MLQRFGPQHGYQIKKIIAEQLSDFTQIKLPTIYYHLEQMGTDGLLFASHEKPGSRPTKTVYSVTEKGIDAFRNMLSDLLDFDYHPTFPADGVFFFSDYLDSETISSRLKTYIKKLQSITKHIENHKEETLQFIPDEMKVFAGIIFDHHERHYKAELAWAIEALKSLSTFKEENKC